MNTPRSPWIRWFSLLSLAALLAVATGCNSGGGKGGSDEGAQTNPSSNAQKPQEISIFLPDFDVEKTPKPDSPAIQEIEKYTNTKITFEWTPNSSYGDKFNITLASGKLPTLMVVTDRSSSFINAVRSGAFWEIDPYLKEYPNLSKANPIVLNNISIDGKIYGVYRARPLGRNGVSIRKDWLDKLGLQIPKTIDEFYNVLKAFATRDPDGNGKRDTYGIVVTKYNGPWDIMSLWFGAPNKWGEDASGKLVPAHLTPEYMEALRFFKKLYDEKLVNQDFAVMDPAKWTEPVINGKAGVIVDVTDQAQRIEDGIHKVLKNAGQDDPNKTFMDVFGSVSGPKGLRILATSGYAGQISVTKSAVKSEDELRRMLQFLDKMNDPEMQNVAGYGIENRHYKKVEGGIEPTTDAALLSEVDGLNQMPMFFPAPEDRLVKTVQTPIRKKSRKCSWSTRSMWSPTRRSRLSRTRTRKKGAQLDTIINDARTKFIVGQIDEAGFQAAVDLWRKSGGDDYIKEINELYQKVKSSK